MKHCREKKKKKRNGTVKNEALVSLSILSMKKVNLNICPELRMNPSATFMSFEKLGNISALFSNSWVIIEVINEVGCITWEDAFSGCWYWRGKIRKRSWIALLLWPEQYRVTSFFSQQVPKVSEMWYQASWVFLPPLIPPAVNPYAPLHAWPSVPLEKLS